MEAEEKEITEDKEPNTKETLLELIKLFKNLSPPKTNMDDIMTFINFFNCCKPKQLTQDDVNTEIIKSVINTQGSIIKMENTIKILGNEIIKINRILETNKLLKELDDIEPVIAEKTKSVK